MSIDTPPLTSRRSLLPMTGITHANRSAVTCHLRCGDACAQPVPNQSAGATFAEIAAGSLSRRTVLGGALAVALVPAAATQNKAAAAGHARDPLTFSPIAPVAADVDAMTVPNGFRSHVLIRWGDPILPGAQQFDVNKQTPQRQAAQFGYNNDYADIIATGKNRAVLVCNHEYTNENIMFPPQMDPTLAIRTAWEAHGMSVVELKRPNGNPGARWAVQRNRPLNRRITLTTPFVFDGPAKGSDLLKTKEDPTGSTVRGTMNNCSGGTTPWGTVLSGEENINQYFYAAGTSAEEKRYGFGPTQDTRGWHKVDPRWDATNPDYHNEINRFGWIVEVDPMDPKSTPVKHTAMGRFKHEGANVIVAGNGKVVAYMGDDERFEYVYKFVSKNYHDNSGTAAARKHNLTLLSEGDLFVARFTGDGFEDGVSDGTGEWLPLTRDGASLVEGMSIEQVLVNTRLAASKLSPTKMDRPEDVQPNLLTGRIYVACTNNSRRTAAEIDEANPRAANKDGHIVEIQETGDNTALSFSWNLLLICGDPATAGTYFGGYTGPVSPISCPDNVAFDSVGNLWISTDGQPSSINYADGLFKVPLTGPERGHVQQFLAVPAGAETCGPIIHDRDRSVFVAVQHPGEDGTWDEPQSLWPDFVKGKTTPRGKLRGPRPSVVQVTQR